MAKILVQYHKMLPLPFLQFNELVCCIYKLFKFSWDARLFNGQFHCDNLPRYWATNCEM